MYSFNIFSILSLACADIYLLVGVYILLKNPKVATNRLFLMVALTMFIWGLGEGLERASIDPKNALFWATYVAGVGSALHPAFLVHFWMEFSGKMAGLKKGLLILVLYIPSLIFLALRFFNPQMLITGVVREYWGYSTSGTPLYLLYMFYVVFYIAIAAFFIFQTAFQTSGDFKKQARNIGIGLLLSLLLGFITQASRPLLHLPLPELSVISTIIYISLLVYAVEKYGFMGITTKLIAENIITTMEDYVIAIDKNLNIALVNDLVVRDLGYQREELLNKPLSTLILGDIASLPYDQLIEHVPMNNYQVALLAKDGNKIAASANASALKDEAGEGLGLVFVLRDVRQINELIGNLRQRTDDLEASKRELEQANEQLGKSNEELKQMNQLMIGRELTMAEMKKETERLRSQTDA